MDLNLVKASPHFGGVRTQPKRLGRFSIRFRWKLIYQSNVTVRAHIESGAVLGPTLRTVLGVHVPIVVGPDEKEKTGRPWTDLDPTRWASCRLSHDRRNLGAARHLYIGMATLGNAEPDLPAVKPASVARCVDRFDPVGVPARLRASSTAIPASPYEGVLA